MLLDFCFVLFIQREMYANILIIKFMLQLDKVLTGCLCHTDLSYMHA